MKKQLFTLSILTLLGLVACGGSKDPTKTPTPSVSPTPSEEVKELSIASPKGAPALALIDRLFNSKTEINTPDNVQTWLTTGTYDAVIAPTNAGAALIKAGKSPYLLAANITFGNFFLASTGNDDNANLDKDDYIVVFQKNGIPHKLFEFVYGSDYTNLHFVNDNTDSVRTLVSGVDSTNDNAEVDYVLIAQPGLFGAKAQNEKVAEYSNLQTLYKEKTGGKEITQASLFIKNTVNKSSYTKFMNEIKTNVESILENPVETLDRYLGNEVEEKVTAKLGAKLPVLKNVMKSNGLGLGFKSAYENKANIDEFLVNLGLDTATNEEIYLK